MVSIAVDMRIRPQQRISIVPHKEKPIQGRLFSAFNFQLLNGSWFLPAIQRRIALDPHYPNLCKK
jgi:hypothetical protein